MLGVDVRSSGKISASSIHANVTADMGKAPESSVLFKWAR
jgi:hypothetical protein